MNRAWLVCQPCLDSVPALFEPVCARCGCPDARSKNENKCTNCPPGKIWFSRARGAVPFTGVTHTLIFKLKYECRIEYANLLALAMAHCYADIENRGAEIIVPVPLHSTRQRQRGFNQAALIARHFGKIQKLEVAENLLARIKAIPSQTRLRRIDRRRNVAGAFACENPESIRGKRLLLVDDVYTTGSTLNECARMLMEAGAESVECLAYARSVLE